MDSSNAIVIGKITGAHGLDGKCKVYSYAESPSIFEPGTRVRLRPADGRELDLVIEWSKPQRNTILMAFTAVTNRNQAETLIGSDILLTRATLPDTEEGTYYWFDIIGLAVYHVDQRYLGQVVSIFPTGSNDVYVVKDPQRDPKYEVLIPAIESVVVEIDIEKKIMRVDLPEELMS